MARVVDVTSSDAIMVHMALEVLWVLERWGTEREVKVDSAEEIEEEEEESLKTLQGLMDRIVQCSG